MLDTSKWHSIPGPSHDLETLPFTPSVKTELCDIASESLAARRETGSVWIHLGQINSNFLQKFNDKSRFQIACIWVLPHDELQYLLIEGKCKFGLRKRGIIPHNLVYINSGQILAAGWIPSSFIVPSGRISINQAWSESKWIYTNNQGCTEVQSQIHTNTVIISPIMSITVDVDNQWKLLTDIQ